MSKVPLDRIVRHCDQLLRTSKVGDFDGAVNGLQVQNGGTVSRIAAAVDGSLTTVKLAVAARADLFIVHHGLFWGPSHPWTAHRYELLKVLLRNNVAVYSSHLPLDVHPKIGNNVLMCHALGLKQFKPFFHSHGQCIGLIARGTVKRSELAKRYATAVGGRTLVIPGGPEVCRNIAVITGGAGSELKKVAEEGADTFLTGEGPHWTYAMAEELGVNVFYGGHYATETFGVKALAAHLSQRFKVPWTYIDHPTGL